ncbi:MAG: endonuclease/exonuclease/phosphatase family protein, partial [Muribaculaceae bacterium]|nr:endonuclease/exonuclease/phosphatase family protein [Muribaculaceae bacterium]
MNKLRLRVMIASLTLLLCLSAASVAHAQKARVYGVAFYNLENLFDTINNNGKYDLEFSPKGSRAWDGAKYWKKIHNMAYAISRMTTKTTPEGPAVIGVSEIENITVLQDLVKAEPIAARGYKIVHHDSPDARGIDVGLLYNPKQFRV